jgi:hypothetical protein
MNGTRDVWGLVSLLHSLFSLGFLGSSLRGVSVSFLGYLWLLKGCKYRVLVVIFG